MKISKEFKVGLLAVVSITVLYLGFNFLRGIDFFSSTDTYYAVYEEIDGLNVSNDVILNGLAVGRVSDIKILPRANNQILVEMDVDKEVRLNESTIALLKNKDFLGSKAIELIVTEVNINSPLDDGDTLKARLDKGLTDILAETAGPVADDLNTTIRRVNLILEELANNTDKISNTLSNVEETSRIMKNTFQENRNDINSLISNYNQVALELAYVMQDITPILNNVTQLTDSLQTLELSQTLQQTQQTIGNLNETIGKINQGSGTLAKLINDDSLYNNLNKSAEDLDKLLNDLRENPGRYVNFSLF